MGIRLIIFLVLVWTSGLSMAASCCGGGASLPNLITGDYRGQFSLVGSNSAVTHDADGSKRDGGDQEVLEALTISGAYLISPLWQAGLSLPYKQNTHRIYSNEETSQGVGDLRAQLAYEFLPEYGYSLWKPKGYLFLEQSFPTSKSIHDSEKPLQTDSMGTGLYNTSLGFSFVKVIGKYDFVLMGEVHKTMSQRFEESDADFVVESGTGNSALFAFGVSPQGGNLRLGSSLLYSYNSEQKISGDINETKAEKYFWELGLSASYLVGNYSYTVSYLDKTLVGGHSNSALSKSITFGLLKFFEL